MHVFIIQKTFIEHPLCTTHKLGTGNTMVIKMAS